MVAKVQKWGNSLALRLPKALAEVAQFREGVEVELVSIPGGVLVRPRRKQKPRYRLSDLLAGITAEKTHPETDWGPSAGKAALE
jgi:antitoxin MazE